MNKNLKILTTCTLSMTVLMIIMYVTSPAAAELKHAGFDRKIDFNQNLSMITETTVGESNYYIAGCTEHSVFIGDSRHPFDLLEYSKHLDQKKEIKIKLVGIDSIKGLSNFRTVVKPPYFFISNGVMPEILRGTVGNWEAKRFLPDSGIYFVDAVPLSSQSLILRSMALSSKTFQLGKRQGLDTPYFAMKPNILEKQIDGIIDVHGTIHYDSATGQVVYLYAYRNEFIVLDSNLELKFKAHTIDTFKSAHVRIETVKSKNQSIVASPPTTINAAVTANKKQLFVQSNLLAQNEKPEVFATSSVIDRYDLESGNYLDSFYIPNIGRRRATDFRILNNNVVALYRNQIVVFKPHKPINNDQNKPISQ